MRKQSRTFKRVGSAAGRLLLAGCVASAFMPAAAFASDTQSEAVERATALAKVVNTGTEDKPTYALQWPDGKWVQTDDEAKSGTYKWKTYIRGDNSHYGHYDALVTFKVEDGTLKEIDLSSEGDTFGGKWGTLTPHSGQYILGYLPAGVKSTADTSGYESTGTIKNIGLDGAGKLAVASSGKGGKGGKGGTSGTAYSVEDVGSYGGYSIASVSLRQVNSEGKVATTQKVDPSDGDTDTVAVGHDVADVSKDQDDATLIWTAKDRSLTVKAKAPRTGDSSEEGDAGTGDGESETGNTDETAYNALCIVYQIGDYYKFEQRIALTDDAGVKKYVEEKTDISQEPTGIGAKDRDVYTAAAYNLIVRKELASWLAYTDGSNELADIDTVSAATKSSQSIIEAIYASQGISYPWSNNDSPTATPDSSWPKLYTSVADDVKVTIDGTALEDDATKAEQNANGQWVLTNKLFGDDVAVAGFDLYSLDSSLSNAAMWRLAKGDSKASASASYMTNNISATGHGIVGAYGKKDANQGTRTIDGVAAPDDILDDSVMSYDPNTKALTIKDPNVTHVVVQYAVGKFIDANGGTCGVAYELDATHTIQVKRAKDKAAQEAAAEANLANAAVSLSQAKYIYDGKAKTPAVTVKSKGGKLLAKGKDYSVAYSGNTNAGTAKVTVSGKGSYRGSKSTTFSIGKATPAVKVKAASYKVAYGKKYKKKKTTKKLVGKSKVTFTATLGAKTSISAAAKKGKVSIAKNGKITVAKGCKAGTYKVPVKVKTAATSNLKAVSKTVSVTVKVAKK